MAYLLIVYGSTEGQTERIADEMVRRLGELGHKARAFPVEAAPIGNELADYDGFIVGASVHMGHFSKEMGDWVKHNFTRLQRKPSAFFSVCLGILEKDLKTQREERRIVDDFLRENGWSPDLDTIFAGALAYSKYGLVKKQLMKVIAMRAGGDTDTTHDHEYTNWEAVRAFAERFAERFQKPGTLSAV